ncbi:oligosaccharide flippase family protein [Pollutibacter soli]|uniref:oligosaccharide flippase family protein n=1 Tax=Pollutibacter soli TaxID=3034157 RepID=UPI003013CAC3
MSNTVSYFQSMLKKVTSNRIVNNFSTITLSNILVQGITIFSSIKIAKGLAPEDFGIFSYLLVLSNIYLVLSGLGMRQVIIRTIAVNPSQSNILFRKSFLLRTLIFLPLVVSIIIYNNYFSKIHFDQLSVILLSANILFLSIWDTLESVNYGYQSMKQPSIIQLFSTALWVVIILLLPSQYIQVNVVMGITVGLQILRTAVLYFRSQKNGFISLSAKNATPLKINLVRESSSFFLLSVFTLITTQIPVVYLEQNASDTEIAFYNIALRIIGPVQMLLLTFMNVLYPVVSRIFANDGEKFTNSIKNVYIFLMLLGNTGAFVLSLFSKEIILLMYGEAYVSSAIVFNVQIWYTILYSILCYIGMILSAINKQVLLAKLSFAYAIVATPCLFIGSKYGAIGLSMGFLVSSMINLSYHYYFLQKSLPTEIPWRVIFVTTGIFFLLMLVTYLTHQTHFLVRIAAGLATIGVLLFVLRKQIRRSIKELMDTR